MIKKASGYNVNGMESNFGNTSKVRFRHVFTDADADGDVIVLGKMGFGLTYFSTQIASKSGLGPGVTVDVGYHGNETCSEVPEFFVAGHTGVATAGESIISTLRVMENDGVKSCDCSAPGTPGACDGTFAELHDVVATIHGSPAAGACLDVVLEYEHRH